MYACAKVRIKSELPFFHFPSAFPEPLYDVCRHHELNDSLRKEPNGNLRESVQSYVAVLTACTLYPTGEMIEATVGLAHRSGLCLRLLVSLPGRHGQLRLKTLDLVRHGIHPLLQVPDIRPQAFVFRHKGCSATAEILTTALAMT